MRWIFLSLLAANVVLLGWLLLFRADSPGISSRQQGGDADHTRVGVPPITLLHEAGEAKPKSAAPSIPDERSTAGEGHLQPNSSTPKEKLCTFVGPFEGMRGAEELVERLQAMDVTSEAVKVDIPAGPGYWLHLPPLDSRRAALRKLADLQALGVDSYIIPRGELMNGISLGMFSKEPLATARLEELRDMGLDARLDVVDRTFQEVWVSIPKQSAQYLNDQAWERLLQGKKNTEHKQNLCLAVASGDNIH